MVRRICWRAWLSVVRAPKRTLLHLFLFFVIGLLLGGGMLIEKAMDQAVVSMRGTRPLVAAIVLDPNAPPDFEASFFSRPDLETVHKIGQLPQVAAYEVSLHTSILSSVYQRGIFPVNMTSLPENIRLGRPQSREEIYEDIQLIQQGFRGSGALLESFPIRGTATPEPMDFYAGLLHLTSGRFLTEGEIAGNAPYALVSQAFADMNQVDVGTILAFENQVYEPGVLLESDPQILADALIAGEPVFLTVIGIFDTAHSLTYYEDVRLLGAVHDHSMLHNQVFVPFGAAQDIAAFQIAHHWDNFSSLGAETVADGMRIHNIFLINQPQDFQAFLDYANSLLSPGWIMDDLSADFNSLLAAQASFGLIGGYLVRGTYLGGSILVFLALLGDLKTRKAELQLLLALGEKKSVLFCQKILETLPLLSLSFLLSLAGLALFSPAVSTSWLRHYLLTQEEMGTHPAQLPSHPLNLRSYSIGPASSEEILSRFQLNFDLPAITQLGLFLTLICLIAIGAAFLWEDPAK